MESQNDGQSVNHALSLGHCIASLAMVLLGTVIYVFFRRDILFVEVFIDKHTGLFSAWSIAHADNPLVHFGVYCLPDALWYAGLLVIQYPLSLQGPLNRLLYFACVAMPFAIELAQAIHWMPGTFDIADIITYILTFIFITICLKQKLL